MKKNNSIFSYEINLFEMPEKGHKIRINATEKDCKKIAQQMEQKEIKDLHAYIEIKKNYGIFQMSGKISCDILLKDVVSLEEFWEPIDTEFSEEFKVGESEKENNEIEEIYIHNSQYLDIASVIFEYILLEIPSYPRKGEEVFFHQEFSPEETNNPFAGLKEKLGGDTPDE